MIILPCIVTDCFLGPCGGHSLGRVATLEMGLLEILQWERLLPLGLFTQSWGEIWHVPAGNLVGGKSSAGTGASRDKGECLGGLTGLPNGSSILPSSSIISRHGNLLPLANSFTQNSWTSFLLGQTKVVERQQVGG